MRMLRFVTPTLCALALCLTASTALVAQEMQRMADSGRRIANSGQRTPALYHTIPSSPAPLPGTNRAQAP